MLNAYLGLLTSWVERVRVLFAPLPVTEATICRQCQRFVPEFSGIRHAEVTYCGDECDGAAQTDAL